MVYCTIHVGVTLLVLFAALTLPEPAGAQGTLQSINGFTPPYIFGEFLSLPHAATSFTCASTGHDCLISVQLAGQCANNALTLSSYTVPDGTTFTLNMTKSNAVVGSLYELCLHPNVASTLCVGSSMYYILMPNVPNVANLVPLTATTGYQRPYVVAPFQRQGALPKSRLSAFQLNLTIPAVSPSLFPAAAVTYFSLLPTCDYNPSIAQYLQSNTTTASSAQVIAVRSASGSSYSVTFAYDQLFHLWNMVTHDIGAPASSYTLGGTLEGRLCGSVAQYRINTSYTMLANALASKTSFPFDLGVSVRLATNFRVNGARVYREEDTTSTGASGSTTALRLMSGVAGGTSTFVFDGVAPASPSTLASLPTAIAADQAAGISQNVTTSFDIRDASYSCEQHSTTSLQARVPPSSNPRYAYLFATGTWDATTSLVSWSTLVNRTFPGNAPSSLTSGIGGATGLLCLYVFNIPVLSLHVGGGVFTIQVDGPDEVLSMNNAYLAAAQGGSAANAATISATSVLYNTDSDITFNMSASAPSLNSLRFTTSVGLCAGVSSSSTPFVIQSTNTRFLTAPSASWFATLGLRRLCVAVVLNSSDTLPYFFQDLAVPTFYVVTAFSRVALPVSGSTSPSVRFFVPLNAPTFSLALLGFASNTSPYASGRLSLTFSMSPLGCLGTTLASSSVTTLTAFSSGATFGVAASLTPQLSLLATRFPKGTFASDDTALLCIGDTTTIASPASPMPLLTSSVFATFYTMFVAAQSVSTAASSLQMQGTGLPTLVVYAHPTRGIRIPLTVLVRTGTQPSLWSLASVLGVVRLSAGSSSDCTTANGALPPMSLSTQWSSVDGADSVRIAGEAVETNAARVAASTGTHYVCFHSLHDSVFQEQESLYSSTAFQLGVVSFASLNGIDVSSGPSATVVGVIQFVSFDWVVTGSGFSSAGIIQMTIGGVIASTPLTVINDTTAIFTFSPQTSGQQQVNVTLGVTLAYLTYPLLIIDVVGVAAIGTFGTTYTAMIAGDTSVHAISLTSSVSVLPSVCLASSVVTTTQVCTCLANVNATMLSTTSLLIDLSTTSPTSVVGNYPICFQYNSIQHFTTGYSVVVLPQLASLGGTAASSGSVQNISFVRGTAPSLVATFRANIPTAASPLRLVMYDVDNTIDLGGSGACSALRHHANVTINATNVISIDFSQGAGTTDTVAQVSLLMTASNQTAGRQLCSTIVLASRFAGGGEPITSFVDDLNLGVVLGTLTLNGIALNSGTNFTTPVLSQANTTLTVLLPSFVASTTFLQFGIASTSCADLPTTANGTAVNQTIAITNLTLQFTSGGGSTANITVPAGMRSATSDLYFCARWLESSSYAFTGVFLSVLYVSAFDRQTASVNTTTQRLTLAAGSAIMRNATRLITMEGERVNAACLRIVLLPSAATSCSESGRTVFQGSVAQTTQQFSVSSATATDYAAMCLMVYRSCSARVYPASLMVDAPLSILDFEAFDIDSTTLTNLNQQQSELMALVSIPMTNTLYGLISYSLSSVATLPFVALLAQPSTDTSCLISQTTYRFPVEEVLDGGGLTTLGIVSNIPTAPTTSGTTFTVCILRNVSSTDQRYFTLGMTLLVSSLTMGGSVLGQGNSISLTINKAPELTVTGSNLNLMLLYVAMTDLGSCSSATLTGNNAVGISRIPSTVVSCSSSKGSVTFTSATNQTTTPLALCIAGVPSSSGKATALSLNFYQANLSVAVTQALSLSVVTEPSSIASSDGSLSSQPVLGVRGPDNSLIQNVPSGIIITASWVAVSPYVAVESICDLCKITTDGEAFLLSATSSASLFSNAKFGVKYVLNYTSDRADIDSVVTSTVKRGLCPITQFGSLYSTQCEDCLSSSYCTGDVDYTMRTSYWRANNKTNFIYDCSPPYGAAQCLGNTSTGTCTEGHNGPRCTICDPGYGKSLDVCVLCSSFTESMVTVVFLACAYIVLVVFATFSSVNGMDDKRDTKHLPILIKLLATHLAMASTVGEFSSQFPDLLNNLFSGMRSTSRPSPQFAALDCSIHPTVYQSFLFLILIPLFTFFAVLAGSFFVRLIHHARDRSHDKDKSSVASLRESVAKQRNARAEALAEASRKYLEETSPDNSPEGSPARSRVGHFPEDAPVDTGATEIQFATFDEIPVVTDEERELMHAEEDLADYVRAQELRLDTKTLFLIALVVVLLFAYPTIVEQSLNLLKCDSIEFGEIQPDLSFSSASKSLYFYDRSLECTSSDHQFYTLLAYASIFAYGLGIPFASIAMVLWFRKNRGITYTNRLFVFLVCGYDEDRWWWEAVVLWRKLALAFILVFINDQRLQTYAALWLLMLALSLQMWLEPYDEVNLDRLATASLAIVIVTLNFSLLYDYLPKDSTSASTRAGNTVLTVCLFCINAVLIIILVGLILVHALLEMQYQISMNAKMIRRTLPLSVQNCLFRFARRPLVTFHKILKKREREKERKNRIKHVINDADGELVDIVVEARRASRTPGKSPALLSPNDQPLDGGPRKSPGNQDLLGSYMDRRNAKVLREALRREEVFVRDLLQKYEMAVGELDTLRNRTETGSQPVGANRAQLESAKAEFEKIMLLASNSNPTSNVVSPADGPLAVPASLPPRPLEVPELVVEDLTHIDLSVNYSHLPSAVAVRSSSFANMDEWSPSAPLATNDGSRRSRITQLQAASPFVGGRNLQPKPKLKTEMNASSSERDINNSVDDIHGEHGPPLEWQSLNDTQRASRLSGHLNTSSNPQLGSTISAKNRKRMERAIGESNLLNE